jgi:hypothetical protein
VVSIDLIGSAAACRIYQPANPADENIRRNTPEGYSDLHTSLTLETIRSRAQPALPRSDAAKRFRISGLS